jgi:thioredoxin reductase
VKYPAKVVVAGGGIGGLTAAIALRRAGFEVPIFFSSSAAGMFASTSPRQERISPAEAGVPRRDRFGKP